MIPNRQIDMRPVIYLWTNTVNGKIYVGSATRLYTRYYSYKSGHLKARNGSDPVIHRAMRKHGFGAFSLSVLEDVIYDPDSIILKERLLSREQYWIDTLCSCDRSIGYNTALIAGSSLGLKHSAATKAKISKSKSGVPLSDIHRRFLVDNLSKYKERSNRYPPKPVYQIDKTTLVIIAKFDSAQQASRALGLDSSGISAACRNTIPSAYGFYWAFVADVDQHGFIPRIAIKRPRYNRRVEQLDECGVVIKIWHRMSDAKRALGVTNATLYHAAKHGGLSHGYRWRYAS